MLYVIILVAIVYLVARYRLFEKMGLKGWQGIIPVYSDGLYFEVGGSKSWVPIILILNFFLFYLLGEYVKVSRSLSAFCIFFETIMVIYFALVFIKVNYVISQKFKRGYFGAFLLTCLPFVGVPVFAFSKNFKFSKHASVKYKFLDKSFYDHEVSVGEMCLSKVLSTLFIIAAFYIIGYVYLIDLPRELLISLVLDKSFIIFILVGTSILAILGTIIDYYASNSIKK